MTRGGSTFTIYRFGRRRRSAMTASRNCSRVPDGCLRKLCSAQGRTLPPEQVLRSERAGLGVTIDARAHASLGFMSQKKKSKDRRRKRERLAKEKRHVRSGPAVQENRQFNRLESRHDHLYLSDYGTRPLGSTSHRGWIKCRLLHGTGYSLIVADQLYVDSRGLRWIQPLAFGPNVLCEHDAARIVCDLSIDVSCGQRLRVQFFNSDHVRDLPDGSQLFECTILGPHCLAAYCTGRAEWGTNGHPYIQLFHHTTPAARSAILDSGHFLAGSCNIQGAQKRLVNVSYAYFTPLDSITVDNDLKKIGMAAGGVIELRRDGFTVPKNLFPGWQDAYKNEVLQLPVYVCDAAKRQAVIDVWVDAAILAPQHLYRHDEGGSVYYEVPHHFIHRVGTKPDQRVYFDENRRIHPQGGTRSFDYIVVGDCRELAGLAAPYDEEDTTHVMKLERVLSGTTLLDFWIANGNRDLYTGKVVEVQEFSRPASDG